MQAVLIPDELFLRVQRGAAASGTTESAYVSGLIEQSEADDPNDFDRFFTPEIVEELDSILREVQAGAKTYTLAEVDEFLAENRKEWLATRPI